jgi:hypothetical protein
MCKPANRGVFWKPLKSLERGVSKMSRGVFGKCLKSLGFEKWGVCPPPTEGGRPKEPTPLAGRGEGARDVETMA